METAPILLFAYRRPLHTREALQSLAANALAAESDLFVYSDGAKGGADEDGVAEVRRVVREIRGFKSVHIVERERNMGLAANITDGVTTIVNRRGRVIVLEDDLVVAPHFLQFMNDALEAYKDEPRVGHVHACEFTQDPSLPDTFLIKWTGCWGWGTWARAWKLFNPDGKALLEELRRRRLTRTFDFGGRYGFTRMLRRQTEGKNDSWAIRWNASLFLADVLSLNAGRSLVRNCGFDGSGTNCGEESGLYTAELWQERIRTDKSIAIQENTPARKALQDYYRRTYSFKSKALRRLKKEFSRLWRIG